MLLLWNLALMEAQAAPAMAPAERVQRVPEAQARALRALPVRVGGRVVHGTAGRLTRQWPGTYFETAFTGRSAYFRVGPGDVTLHAKLDGQTAETLVKPTPGLYRIDAPRGGRHTLRIEVASESQAGA